jgi:hypothetical protein
VGGPAVYVETLIRAPIERVWELTQDPALHSRWDLRFTRIIPVPGTLASGGYRFRYERRIPLHTIAGTGTSLGERESANGSRTSALRFDTDDRLSPLGEGRGYWRYTPVEGGTLFVTGFDYAPGWGGLVDRLVMRRIIGWMTAWSFDRLRVWAEDGVEPERWPISSVLAFGRADRPRADRCRRTHPARADAMHDSPDSLARLEAP